MGRSTGNTIEGAFRRFDSDGGGSLDYREFQQALESLGVKVTEEQLALLCQLLDADGDGDIDYNEFVDWFRGGTSQEAAAAECGDTTRPSSSGSGRPGSGRPGSSGSSGGGEKRTYAQQVQDIFKEYAPRRLREVPGLMIKYEYDEARLIAALRKEFNVAADERARRDAARMRGEMEGATRRKAIAAGGTMY